MRSGAQLPGRAPPERRNRPPPSRTPCSDSGPAARRPTHQGRRMNAVRKPALCRDIEVEVAGGAAHEDLPPAPATATARSSHMTPGSACRRPASREITASQTSRSWRGNVDHQRGRKHRERHTTGSIARSLFKAPGKSGHASRRCHACQMSRTSSASRLSMAKCVSVSSSVVRWTSSMLKLGRT